MASKFTPKFRHPRAGGDPCDHLFVLSSKSGSIRRQPSIVFGQIQNAETLVDPRLRGDDGICQVFEAYTQLDLIAVKGA